MPRIGPCKIRSSRSRRKKKLFFNQARGGGVFAKPNMGNHHIFFVDVISVFAENVQVGMEIIGV